MTYVLSYRNLISKDPAIVKLTAESDDKVFITVHKELLCGFSPYYRAAIDGSFEEANKSSFTAKTTPEALCMFGRYLYTRDLVHHDDVTLNLNTLVDLYIFADMIGAISLRRDIITVWSVDLDEFGPRFPSYKAIDKMNQNLPENSPLRMLMLQSHIWHWEPTHEVVADAEEQSTALAFMTAVALGKHEILTSVERDSNEPNCPCCNEPCKYHEHVSEEERRASK